MERFPAVENGGGVEKLSAGGNDSGTPVAEPGDSGYSRERSSYSVLRPVHSPQIGLWGGLMTLLPAIVFLQCGDEPK